MEFFVSQFQGKNRISLKGNCTYNDSKNFKQVAELISKMPPQTVYMDFQNVPFMDSAALGQLLLVRDAAIARGIEICLEGAHGQVQNMFKISRFDVLFSIAS